MNICFGLKVGGRGGGVSAVPASISSKCIKVFGNSFITVLPQSNSLKDAISKQLLIEVL